MAGAMPVEPGQGSLSAGQAGLGGPTAEAPTTSLGSTQSFCRRKTISAQPLPLSPKALSPPSLYPPFSKFPSLLHSWWNSLRVTPLRGSSRIPETPLRTQLHAPATHNPGILCTEKTVRTSPGPAASGPACPCQTKGGSKRQASIPLPSSPCRGRSPGQSADFTRTGQIPGLSFSAVRLCSGSPLTPQSARGAQHCSEKPLLWATPEVTLNQGP